MPTLREFCEATASTITSHLLGVTMSKSDSGFEKIVQDLENEFRTSYEKEGKPYGDSEEDMVRYLIDSVVFDVQDDATVEIEN